MMIGEGRSRKNAIAYPRGNSSEARSVSDRFSLYSSFGRKKSRSTSPESDAAKKQNRVGKWLKPREYLLLMIEAAVAVASRVIHDRITRREHGRLDLTIHQKGIFVLYIEGYSALASLFVGCLADSYFSYYTLAFISVAIHFAAICVHFMDQVLKGHPKGNQYTAVVRNVRIKTECLRLVYGLEGMTKRRKSTVYCFLFLHFWVSSYATYGGVLTTYFSAHWETLGNESRAFKLPIASFALSGLSLFLFVYALQPGASVKEQRGLGFRVASCLLLATFYKMFGIHRRWKKGFFGNTERTYDKTTIFRAKEILVVYALLLPAFGVTLSTMLNTGLFYEQMIRRMKTEGAVGKIGIFRLARMIQATSMLVSYFGLWPLLVFLGVKNSATVKFLFGHLLIALSLLYAAMLFKRVEHLPHSTSSGLVRVFNTRKEPVTLIPEGRDFATREWLVESKTGIMTLYPCSARMLFPMRIVFNGTKSNYTTFLNVSPGELTGYVVLDPPEIGRIRGPYLPLREGPPGTNIQGWPRIFIYNTAVTLKDAKVRIEVNKNNQWKTIRVIKTHASIMTTMALEQGTYKFSLEQTRTKRTIDIEEGGFYGVLVHTSTSNKELDVDRIEEPSTASPWPFICRYIIEGLGAGLGIPALRAIVYHLAPQGLTAMSFAFLAFLEGVALWAQYVGYKTWHYYVTANVSLAYAVLVASFFVLSMFVLLKYIRVGN